MSKGPVVTDLLTAAGVANKPQVFNSGRRATDFEAATAAPHPVFRAAWRTINLLLIIWILVAAYSIVWEYSTRRYLQGFSDAIVPTLASPEEKIAAILTWMAHGPTRRGAGPLADSPDRDPTDTLNYDNLLKVCGSATNAFLNLADSSGLVARRLLLLDSHRNTKHVVAEVIVDGRWIVVDPSFHTILRGADGGLLTSNELKDPPVFASATRGIPRYDASYTFETTSHVHLSHVPLIGLPLRAFTDRFWSNWEGMPIISLMLERESLLATYIAITLIFFLALARLVTRYYGETRLGIPSLRFRRQILNACRAFLQTTG